MSHPGDESNFARSPAGRPWTYSVLAYVILIETAIFVFALYHSQAVGDFYATHIAHYDSVGTLIWATQSINTYDAEGYGAALAYAWSLPPLSLTQTMFVGLASPLLKPVPESIQIYKVLAVGLSICSIGFMAYRFRLSVWAAALAVGAFFLPEAAGFPTIDDPALDPMQMYKTLVLLNQDEKGLREGIEPLTAATPATTSVIIVDSGRFQGKVWGFNYLVVRREAAAAPPVTESPGHVGWLDVSTLRSDGGWKPAVVTQKGNLVRIDTYPAPGGFSATVDVPAAFARPGAGVVRVWLSVPKGRLGMRGYPTGDNGKTLVSEVVSEMSERDVLVDLEVDDLSLPLSLMFANGSMDGPTVALVRAIEVIAAEPAAIEQPATDGASPR